MVQADCWRHIRHVIKAIGVEITVSPDMYCHWLKKREGEREKQNFKKIFYQLNIPETLPKLWKCCTICVKKKSHSLCEALFSVLCSHHFCSLLSVIHMSRVCGPEEKTHINTMSAWKSLQFILSEDSIYWMWYKVTAVYYLEILQKRS